MRVDTSTPVVVLGFHHGSLGIARSLGRWGVPVYGVDANRKSLGSTSRYCRAVWIWNLRDEAPDQSVDFLLRRIREIGRKALLIPTSDDSALFVAEHAPALRESYLFPSQSPELIRSLSNKRELYFLARKVGIPTPEAEFPRSVDDIAEIRGRGMFPLVLRGIDGNSLHAGTGKRIVIVRSGAELLEQYAALTDDDRMNLMVQEYIPGGDDTIWIFNGYFDDRSTCLAAFTGKKLRQYPVHSGATSLGICQANDTVARLTIDLMQAIGYRGILDIGFRFDARKGDYKLLDPNPRIGSTFRLFVSENGMDVARVLYLEMTGQPLPSIVPREGRKWLIEDQDLESCLDYRREGTLTLREWVRSLRGVQELAWFASDDLGPFGRMCWGVFRRTLRWITKRVFRWHRASDAPLRVRSSIGSRKGAKSCTGA
jgi:D-aspartate ligase